MGNVDIADVVKGVHESAYFTTRLPDGTQHRAAIASFLEAGCGFGGSCLPKDLAALTAHGRALGLDMDMLGAIQKVNAGQPDEVMRLIGRHVRDLRGVRVAVLGLAFKPDTDDTRESPAFPVIRRLKEAGASLRAYDPVVRSEVHPALSGVEIRETLEESLRDAQVVVLVTRWSEFRELPQVLRRLGMEPLVVDGRRMLDPGDYAAYEGIGR
jgi:UDPglucose 6-dehydrogenase/GDP-mannose 6-dehydrogenase